MTPRSLPSWTMATLGVAQRLHAGQVDKAGAPYWTHLHRVAGLLLRRWPDAPRVQIEAALFHDVLEDVRSGERRLRAEQVSSECVAIVRQLSRPPGLPYLEWIEQMVAAGNESVLRVKWADIRDNLSPLRPDYPGRADKSRTRYAPALAMVEDALQPYFLEVDDVG